MSRDASEGPDLLHQTLRTVGVLLVAWAVFVGTLSLVTVLVVGKAVGGNVHADDHPAIASSDVGKRI